MDDQDDFKKSQQLETPVDVYENGTDVKEYDQ